MVKKYRDADEVIKATIEVPKDLYLYESLMKEVPNFNKVLELRKYFREKNIQYIESRMDLLYIILTCHLKDTIRILGAFIKQNH